MRIFGKVFRGVSQLTLQKVVALLRNAQPRVAEQRDYFICSRSTMPLPCRSFAVDWDCWMQIRITRPWVWLTLPRAVALIYVAAAWMLAVWLPPRPVISAVRLIALERMLIMA